MILKFKRKDSNAWYYETLGNVIIGKVDLSNVVTKYTNKDNGKLDINENNFSNVFNDISNAIRKEIGSISYGGNIDSIKNTLQNTYYVVIKDNSYDGDLKLISTEAYLMTDEGKTIERLM